MPRRRTSAQSATSSAVDAQGAGGEAAAAPALERPFLSLGGRAAPGDSACAVGLWPDHHGRRRSSSGRPARRRAPPRDRRRRGLGRGGTRGGSARPASDQLGGGRGPGGRRDQGDLRAAARRRAGPETLAARRRRGGPRAVASRRPRGARTRSKSAPPGRRVGHRLGVAEQPQRARPCAGGHQPRCEGRVQAAHRPLDVVARPRCTTSGWSRSRSCRC